MDSKVCAGPTIKAEVTFLSHAEGGRSTAVGNSPEYRPHLIVGDPGLRGLVTAPDGRTLVGKYLGITFTGGGEKMLPGKAYLVDLCLLYSPQVDYSELVPGATFTIREGPRVVGFGSVKGE